MKTIGILVALILTFPMWGVGILYCIAGVLTAESITEKIMCVIIAILVTLGVINYVIY